MQRLIDEERQDNCNHDATQALLDLGKGMLFRLPASRVVPPINRRYDAGPTVVPAAMFEWPSPAAAAAVRALRGRVLCPVAFGGARTELRVHLSTNDRAAAASGKFMTTRTERFRHDFQNKSRKVPGLVVADGVYFLLRCSSVANLT